MALETTYASRNIGDVFYTLRKDASLNGAVPTDGKEYSLEDFSISEDINSLPYLLVNKLVPVLSYAEYAAAVKTDGTCASFGYDEINGKFKVPTIKNVYVRAGDSATLAKYLAPGLPDISGTGPYASTKLRDNATWKSLATLQVTGAFHMDYKTNLLSSYKSSYQNIDVADDYTGTNGPLMRFDASYSNPIYGASDTVQPPTIVLRPMIQLVTVSSVILDNDPINPSPTVLKVPYIFVPGTEAMATEVNANFDYVLKAIAGSVDTDVVHRSGSEVISGEKTFLKTIKADGLKIIPEETNKKPTIDFYYDGADKDATARLFEAVKGYLSLYQNPPSSDSTTKIATTAWVNSKLQTVGTTTGSNVAKGWVKLPNGLMLQWGSRGTGDVGYKGQVWVSFPTAFPSACFAIAQSTDINQGTGNKGDSIGTRDLSRTGFNLFKGCEYWSPTVYWIAIGY